MSCKRVMRQAPSQRCLSRCLLCPLVQPFRRHSSNASDVQRTQCILITHGFSRLHAVRQNVSSLGVANRNQGRIHFKLRWNLSNPIYLIHRIWAMEIAFFFSITCLKYGIPLIQWKKEVGTTKEHNFNCFSA